MGLTIKEGWAMLPQPCKVALGWVVVAAVSFGIVSEVVERYSSPLLKTWGDIQAGHETAFELEQRRKDNERAGDPYEVIYEAADARVLLYSEPADMLTVHTWKGVKSHQWKIHPASFGEAPALELTYGEDEGAVPSSAGISLAGGCAPSSQCLTHRTHPGTYRVVDQAQLDQCWFDRRLKWFNDAGWADACILAVPFNACGNYYSWKQSKWVCCDYH